MNANNESIFIVNKIDKIQLCEKELLRLSGSTYRKPTDFIKIKNENHNLDNCESCKKGYLKILKAYENKLKIFPKCCNKHSKLLNQTWFDKNDYKNFSQITTDKLFYSWHFILKKIDSNKWQDEIFEYINYIVYTFGEFPSEMGNPFGIDLYFENLKNLIERNIITKKNEEKRKILLEFLDSFYIKNNKNTDLNILIQTYDKWYKSFPFELSIFKNIKKHFSENIPLFEKLTYNQYLKIEIATPITKLRLVNYLNSVTEKILLEINSLKLYENGKIDDLENLKLEYILLERKLQLKYGFTNESKNLETKYRNTLKTWLADEINFIKNLKETLIKIDDKKDNIFQDLLFACDKMQENKIFWNSDENTRTNQILDILGLKYITKNQSQSGISETGIQAGSIDGKIFNKRIEYIIEAFNISNISKSIIFRHINKLEKNYDSKGLPIKFILAYCNIEDNKFENLYKNYLKYIDKELNFHFTKIKTEEIESTYSNKRILKTIHLRENVQVVLYHILLKMPKK